MKFSCHKMSQDDLKVPRDSLRVSGYPLKTALVNQALACLNPLKLSGHALLGCPLQERSLRFIAFTAVSQGLSCYLASKITSFR